MRTTRTSGARDVAVVLNRSHERVYIAFSFLIIAKDT